jgi:hypothetical protein
VSADEGLGVVEHDLADLGVGEAVEIFDERGRVSEAFGVREV